MKVKELIKLLEKQNQEANIYVGCEGYNNVFDVESTTILCKLNDDNFILCDDSRIEITRFLEEIKECEE